jgi:hypothetical protein
VSPDEGDAVASADDMTARGVKRVQLALQVAQGSMKQRAFADEWDLPFGTMQALLQGRVRNYRSTTLAAFDRVLGRSTWGLYTQSEDETDVDEPDAGRSELDELRAEVASLAASVQAFEERISRPAALEAVVGELSAVELDELIAFAHFLLARRRRVNGS